MLAHDIMGGIVGFIGGCIYMYVRKHHTNNR